MKLTPDLVLAPGATVREALEAITRNGQNVVLVLDGERRLVGLVTDGDLRRAILRGAALDTPVEQVMNRSPLVGQLSQPRNELLSLMRARRIRQLPLLDAEQRVAALVVLEELVPPARIPNKAVIVAGGRGSRLHPLTEHVPKPLLRVAGKPLLEIILARFQAVGVSDFFISVMHKSSMIEEYFGDGSRYHVRIRYVREVEPLGTIGSLSLIEEPFQHPVFVMNGDVLTRCDFLSMLEFHERSGVAMTAGIVQHEIQMPYGVFEVEGDRITAIAEKPSLGFWINAGIYVLSPDAVRLVPAGQYFDATDLMRLLLSRGMALRGYPIREYWLDVGRQHDLDKANRDMAEGLLD